MSTAPLDGIRVIDASRVLAGPFATMLLADLGADVVKIEPPEGDETRRWGPPWWGEPTDGRSAYFASVNRNKRSVVLDLRTDDARAHLDRLLDGADLLVHNYRPSTAERLGLAADRLRQRHPHLVVSVIGGFPGDQAERSAYDLVAQAVSGLMSITGEPSGPPMKVGVAVLDLIAGLECAVGALAALVGRGRGGGALVEVSLVEAAIGSLINVLGNHLANGAEPGRHGTAHPNIVPYQSFAARGGALVVAAGTDSQFRRLLDVFGLDDAEARFATNANRLARRQELIAWLEPAIADRDRDELVAALLEADVPAGPVNSVPEAVAAMEASVGPWVEETDGVRLPPSTIRLDGTRPSVRRPPPRLGEHTAEVLGEGDTLPA
ncbi:MAG TPA: CoA transferase [Candidatus Limnocylindria bacterium]|nr:CoA transferase [Candidatus Limnocylindria bacterium]